jgi:hypothetical protein
VDSSGNVGIGTTTPAKNFVVGGARPFLVDTSGVAEVSLRGDSGGWAFRYGARGSANADLGGFGMLGSANTLTSYYIGASQTNPLMTLIQSTGNVGIGTTSPSTKLDVAGGVWTSVAGSARNAAYDLSGGRIAAGLSIYSYGPICTGNNSGICNGTNGVVIGSANTGATVNIPNTGASFFNGGNVGIGTSTPLGLLSVGTGGIADANVPVQIGATSGALTYFGANKGATYGALFGYRNNNSGYTGGEARIIGSESFRILTNDTERLRVTGAGNVGIGTTSTSYRLNVASSSATTYVARITNSDTSNTADGLLISLAVANASRATTNYFVGFSDGAGTVAGKIQGGASAVAYTTTAADLAEYFPVESGNTMPEAGEIVSLDGENGRSVVRATSDTVPFGIVTTNPGFIGNGPICKAKDTRCDERYAEKNALISLVGQVPVKVSNENGDIKMGDSITISSEEGVGMKANFGDTAVGYALEVFDGGGEGQTVMVFANLHTALGMNPDSELLTSLGVDMSEFEEVSVMDRLVELASRFVDGVLTVAGIKTDELCIGDTCVNEAQLIEVLDQIGSTTGGEGNIGEGDDGDESTPSDSVEGGDSGDGTGGGNTEDGDLESVTGDNGGENAPTDPTEGGGNTGGGSGETGA